MVSRAKFGCHFYKEGLKQSNIVYEMLLIIGIISPEMRFILTAKCVAKQWPQVVVVEMARSGNSERYLNTITNDRGLKYTFGWDLTHIAR